MFVYRILKTLGLSAIPCTAGGVYHVIDCRSHVPSKAQHVGTER